MHEFTRAQHRWQIQQIPLRIASPFSILARFSLLQLFPVSKPKEMVRRKEIHYQRAAHRRNRGLFWRVGQIILFGRLEKIGESLDQMYRVERRPCWEVKMNRSKKMCFTKTVFLKTYWLILVYFNTCHHTNNID